MGLAGRITPDSAAGAPVNYLPKAAPWLSQENKRT